MMTTPKLQPNLPPRQRHNLPIVDILNPDGTLNRLAGEDFDGDQAVAAEASE